MRGGAHGDDASALNATHAPHYIYGTDDEFAPFQGGKGPKSPFGVELPSVPETIAAWVGHAACPNAAHRALSDLAGDGTTIERRTYGPDVHGIEAVLYVIEGGGHTWPGMPPFPLSLGKSSANMNANDAIWDFFRKRKRTEGRRLLPIREPAKDTTFNQGSRLGRSLALPVLHKMTRIEFHSNPLARS